MNAFKGLEDVVGCWHVFQQQSSAKALQEMCAAAEEAAVTDMSAQGTVRHLQLCLLDFV